MEMKCTWVPNSKTKTGAIENITHTKKKKLIFTKI